MVVANNDVVRADAIGDWNLTTEIVQSYQFQLLSGGPLANADAMDDLHDIVEDLWLIIQGFLNRPGPFQFLLVQAMGALDYPCQGFMLAILNSDTHTLQGTPGSDITPHHPPADDVHT